MASDESYLRMRISRTFDTKGATHFTLTDARAIRRILDRLEALEVKHGRVAERR